MNKKLVTIFLLGLSLLSFNVNASKTDVYETHPYELKVTKSIFNFYENYEIYSPSTGSATTDYSETYPGTVQKSAFRIRTNYDLSDKKGWQATGISRILSLGSLYLWATQIDIYDNNGASIGMIDGNLATIESAKFSLYRYDELGVAHEVAVAVANQDFTQFTLTTEDSYQPIGELNRDRAAGTWSVVIDTPNVIDDRVVRIFAAFVIDYQDKFS